jgi:hypothetical protein
MSAASVGCFARKAAAAAVLVSAMGVSSIASAVGFSGDYTINAHSSGDGLLIETQKLQNPLAFDVTEGNPVTLSLFKIWTDEGDVAPWEDTLPRNISVTFDFTAPASMGQVDGVTFGGIFFGEYGRVEWHGPEVIDFGVNGKLRVSLTDETFNWGLFGLNEGYRKGATVKATFKLLNDSDPVSEVPLPASLPLFMAALGGLAALRRRTRSAA